MAASLLSHWIIHLGLVLQVGITHYFSILKARQQLGYVPFIDQKEGMRRTIDYWKDRQAKEVISPGLYIWIAILGGMVAVFFCAFVPPPFMGFFEWIRRLAFFLFRKKGIIQAIFVISFLLHVGEAMVAFRLAKQVDPLNVKGWFWQTFALGFPSLRLLIKRSREKSHD